ncbi:MAG: helix-turn-helix transcriptional regulator [Clostridiaceae bacterium]|nr:helix-turn-helix transcriptional regulator [Clostridiaceae bacterium]
MDIRFQAAGQLISDIFNLSIQYLDTEEQIPSFSHTHMIHAAQVFFDSDFLTDFIKMMKPEKIYHVIDKFQIHFILVLLNGKPVIMGPFCTLILTRQDFFKQKNQYQISKLSGDDFLAYRSQFPVISEKDAIHIIHSLVHLLDSSVENWEIKTYDYCGRNTPDQGDMLRKNYSELIQERYQLEQRFMYDIEHGNYHAAILNLRNMQRDVAFLKEIGTTLENERIGAAIVRTMARIAAMHAGLPSSTIDLLSRNNTVAIFNAKNVEDIFKEKEKMVNEFCREIRSHKNHQYSNLVLSAIYYIEHQYAHHFTVEEMAAELSVSTNYLISAFRRETGSTPGNYIRKIRLSQAARLLSTTDLSIQDIGTMAGIPDANYFIKLFKREYKATPNQYRKYHRL